jgi:hypothetical protein
MLSQVTSIIFKLILLAVLALLIHLVNINLILPDQEWTFLQGIQFYIYLTGFIICLNLLK